MLFYFIFSSCHIIIYCLICISICVHRARPIMYNHNVTFCGANRHSSKTICHLLAITPFRISWECYRLLIKVWSCFWYWGMLRSFYYLLDFGAQDSYRWASGWMAFQYFRFYFDRTDIISIWRINSILFNGYFSLLWALATLQHHHHAAFASL